jgi:nicotinic acid mononucleotide adenylyltransferase
VRRRIARGASVRYLIPDPVLEYIEKQRLYA